VRSQAVSWRRTRIALIAITRRAEGREGNNSRAPQARREGAILKPFRLRGGGFFGAGESPAVSSIGPSGSGAHDASVRRTSVRRGPLVRRLLTGIEATRRRPFSDAFAPASGSCAFRGRSGDGHSTPHSPRKRASTQSMARYPAGNRDERHFSTGLQCYRDRPSTARRGRHQAKTFPIAMRGRRPEDALLPLMPSQSAALYGFRLGFRVFPGMEPKS